MSEYDNSSYNTNNNENCYPYNEDENNVNNNNNNNNQYISQNGSKLNLGGIDLSTQEGQLLFNNISKNYPNLSIININNCNLSELPNEFENFKNLSSLDIRENKFQNFEKLIQDLSKFEKLTHLQIDLDDQNQVLLALSNLPNIIVLNGKSTKRTFTIVDVEVKDIEDISLQNYIDEYNQIVGNLNTKDETHTFATKFQSRLYEEGEKIKSCLNNNVPNYIYANTTLNSQLELQKNLAENYLKYLDKENSIIGNYLFKIIFQTGDKLVDLINNLYPKIEEKTENLRNQLEEAWKAAGEISDYETKYKNIKNIKIILESNIELLQTKINKLEKENKILTQKLNNTKNDIIKKNDYVDKKMLSNNNKNYLDTNSYQNNKYNKVPHIQSSNNNKDLKNIKYIQNLPNNQNQASFKPIKNNTNTNNLSSENNNLNNNMNNTNTNDIQQFNNNSLTMNPNRKPLSIKIMKDIINELYISKVNYDKICLENKLANETLEQYMYIFLNNKYGLKNLVLEWASAIINGIKLYSKEDSEINLFGKILKNEQEEDSRLILVKLKENIAELLEYYYKTKYPLKPKKEIDNIMNKKKNGILLEEEWKGIIYYIYNAEDSQIIENKILNFIQEQNNKIFFIVENGEDVNNDRFITYQNNHRNNNNINTEKINLTKKLNTNVTDVFLTEKKRVTREDLNNINKLKEEANIPYKDFIQLVCENQIQNREKYLKKFVKLFRKFDKDGDGVLNEEQFIEMIKAIPYCQNNIEDFIDKFLSIIDPFNHKKFTFNNCVTLFSSEIIDENQTTQSISNQGLSNVDSQNIGLNIQSETTLLDKICLGN